VAAIKPIGRGHFQSPAIRLLMVGALIYALVPSRPRL